jgi:phosphoglycolate phosphatase-like HAD superfamily hydrolase
MPRSTLLLFDVDGTLMLSGGAGTRALACAFQEIFGVADAFRNARIAGRTDYWVLAEALAANDVDPAPAEMARFSETYVKHLRREIQQPGPRKGIMPGVLQLLDALAARPGVHLALLTGNFREGARVKLEYFGLWRYFRGGAFGDDVPDRNLLLPLAVKEASEDGAGPLDPSDVVVVGDTPLDIACAASGQARCVAVATGDYDRTALRAAGAEVVFDDLTDTAAVLRALKC